MCIPAACAHALLNAGRPGILHLLTQIQLRTFGPPTLFGRCSRVFSEGRTRCFPCLHGTIWHPIKAPDHKDGPMPTPSDLDPTLSDLDPLTSSPRNVFAFCAVLQTDNHERHRQDCMAVFCGIGNIPEAWSTQGRLGQVDAAPMILFLFMCLNGPRPVRSSPEFQGWEKGDPVGCEILTPPKKVTGQLDR